MNNYVSITCNACSRWCWQLPSSANLGEVHVVNITLLHFFFLLVPSCSVYCTICNPFISSKELQTRRENGPTAAEQGMARIQHMNPGPPSVESPRPVFKVGSATKMKGDPYVKKTRLPNSQARRRVHFFHSKPL
jgi:hypothetical protein